MSARRQLDTLLGVVDFFRIQMLSTGWFAIHDSFSNPAFRMLPTGYF